jgi:heme-degrading monooxygenase HmoA
VIVEHAVLDVRTGEERAFEAAFREAVPLIRSMRGCRDVRLGACVEHASRFLLLVEWDTLEDHTEGFRRSPEYQTWRQLLHHFYDPFPEVDHYTLVDLAERGPAR